MQDSRKATYQCYLHHKKNHQIPAIEQLVQVVDMQGPWPCLEMLVECEKLKLLTLDVQSQCGWCGVPHTEFNV